MNRKERRRQDKMSLSTSQTLGGPRPSALGTGSAAGPLGSGAAPGGPGAGFNIVEALQRAVGLHQAGRLEEASGIYRQVLAAQPNEFNALNLGGVAASQMGDHAHAVEMLRGAVNAKPGSAEAYYNLGTALLPTDDQADAIAAFGRAVEIKPDYAQAHSNLGAALLRVGRFEEAAAAYAREIEIRPGHPQAHCNLGNVFLRDRKYKHAAAAYRRALLIKPDYVDAQSGLGSALQMMGELDAAIAAFERALEISPDYARIHSNLGDALQAAGRLEEAVAACRRAVELEPEYAKAQYNLGSALLMLDEFDDAAAALRRTLEIKPDDAAAHLDLGNALLSLGAFDDAAASCGRAIEIDPALAEAYFTLGAVELERGDPEATLGASEACLEHNPGHRLAIALKAIALNELGDKEGLGVLYDYDRFVRPRHIQPPERFAGLADFNAALADHLQRHPTLVFERFGNATRSGKHTGEILVEPKGPVADLEKLISAAVEDYLRAVPADPSHPFLLDPPRRFRLTAWGVVMQKQGHQVAHVHPGGWVSGVYYVKVPEVVAKPNQGNQGWIEFGQPPEHLRCAAEPEVKLMQPEEGLMILFPSFFYHRTVPFETEDERICIAFDALPED